MALQVTWRDVAALSIALSALVASVALWADGRVVIGLELTEGSDSAGLVTADGSEEAQVPGVFVSTVVPDGNAARHGIGPRARVVSLTTVDGRPVDAVSTVSPPGLEEMVVQSEFGEATTLPIEAISPERIAGVIVGELYEDGAFQGDPPGVVTYGYASIERQWLESTLRSDIYAVGLGLLVGAVVSVLLWRGWLGVAGRSSALVAGAAAALPLLLVPVVEVGNVIGIYATYAALIAVLLLLAIGLAARLESARARQTAMAAGVGFSGLAAALVVRHMLTPELSPDERGPIAVIMAAIALAPAFVAALADGRTIRSRADNLTLGAMPALGFAAIVPSDVQPAVPPVLIAGVLLVHGLPWERISGELTGGFDRVRSGAASVGSAGQNTTRHRRDILAAGLVATTAVALLVTRDAAWALVLGALAGGAVWFGTRQGVLGPDWSDAAVPLGAAVCTPILLVPVTWSTYAVSWPVTFVTALAALSVAHLVAERHTDPALGRRLFIGACGVAVLAALSSGNGGLEVALMAAIPLVPGIPVAFADRPGAQAVPWRLETLAVALTPGAAATVLIPGVVGALILGGWLALMIVWRYLAIIPLLGFALRSELQRDLAVAAAETERARLAADLHDDALQQLTMLVRSLDEGGHTKEADEAREIATKLRSVVGDLRLPILDDLGAGAALEWLVERVEPLAGGPVKLERSDATRPPANVELAVFRVAQEALNNAIRHGRPPIAVRYDVRADGRVTLAIDDAGDGIGSEAAGEAPSAGHFGLLNMQQRAEQIGGLLDVRRWPAGGTRVALEWRPQ